MSGGMDVDPEALRARSPKFEAAADKLQAAYDTVRQVHEAEHGCWGDDETGETFGADYTKTFDEQIIKGFEFLRESLTGTKTELDKTAASWESDDQGAAENLNNAANTAASPADPGSRT